MKTTTLFKTLLAGLMLAAGVSEVQAACSVTTDSYGKTKVVWDFGIEAKDGNATYYLDAATSAYVESTAYPSAANQRGKYLVAQINVHSSRSIKSNDAPDNDKGSGVILGSSQGYITIYAPVSGTLSLTGKYLTNITVTDKSDSDKKLTTNGSSVKVKQGHRIQLTASNGCGVATMTLTPDDYDTDVVASGNWNFANAEVIRPSYDIAGTNIISTMGYKTSADKTSKNVFIVAANSGGSVRIHPNEEAAGLKLGSGAEFDFTPTNAGWLTINYSYGGDRGTWYIKEGSTNKSFTGTKTSSQVKVYLAAGYRAQLVTGTGSNTSVLITNVTFTESVPATMGAYGYTTFASILPLDLTSLPSGLKAYYVMAEGISKANSKVTMTEATGTVAAGTGLMLKGTANAKYDITVAGTGTDLSSTNKLIGCTSQTAITSSTSNYENFYVLVNTETQAELQNINTYVAGGNTVTIPAGKAYLDATGVSAARLMMAFDDEATGIRSLTPSPSPKGEGSIYTLSGQRINHPVKGMFIRNGKKIVIK